MSFADAGVAVLGGICTPTALTQDADGMLLVLCTGVSPTLFRVWP